MLSSKISAQADLEDVKKEAGKLYEDEEFAKAYKLYSQLVSNYPKDPLYNFRLGVCMIFAEPDKKKCLPFLTQADRSADPPKETKFFLGKANHVNYQFDEALKYYNDFKKTAPSSLQKKLQVDKEIRACVNGKRLLSNLSDLVVVSKKTLNESDYFRSYDLKDIGGKLVVKPDGEGWTTSADKKKKDRSVVFIPKNGDRVYFSSYGSNSDNGKDLYYREKLPNGEYGPPKKVNGVNTEYDEDYPFLHPNGTTLYFSSKGHNSMGGYDVFKSTYIASSDSWSQPVNMEFPVNSPDDDYLFVTDSLEKTAFFSTGRQSEPGKIDVLRINTERKPIDVLALKGTVVKESASQSLLSKITVKNMDNGEVVGVYSAQDNGDYAMDLPNGGKLLFTVETPGLETQSDKVSLPLLASSKPLKQTISYDNGKLKIINYFEEVPTDDSYIQYLKIIEQKAKLEVNEGRNTLKPEVVSGGNSETGPLKKTGTGNTDNGTGPTLLEDTISKKQTAAVATKTVSKQGLSNAQLADLAKQDADESRKEAVQLKQDAADAGELGKTKMDEADKKMKEAEVAIQSAEGISDENEKKLALDKANALKSEAEKEKASAAKILDYAKSLESDAANKSAIARLNNQYVKEVENAINSKGNNTDALNKMESIQKEIAERESRKSESEAIYASIKNEFEEKEKVVQKAEQDNSDDKAALQEIKNDISTSEAELASTRKKKDKEPIQTKINSLKSEQAEKEKKIEANENEIAKLKEDLAASKSSLDMANRVKNETVAARINTIGIGEPENTATTSIASSNTSGGNAEKEVSKALQQKYQDKIVVTDPKDRAGIEESNNQLRSFNKEIDAALAKNKNDLVKAKTAAQKQTINTEIKQLEDLKRQNQNQLASNNRLLDDLARSGTVAANNSKSVELSNVNSNNPDEAIKQLKELDTKISNSNDNSNFEYNGYQNPKAQNLKIEADAILNDVALQQKKLKEAIATATSEIKSAPSGTAPSSKTSASDLFMESENLMTKALEYRTEANSKTGAEKDELLAKAKETEDKANEKHLEASETLKKDNESIFKTNAENLQSLKNQNKATEMDLNESNRLFEEAAVLVKQAANIREEANSMTNIGAKLGNLSNAEEKEAEALSKQEQALFIMKKSSPNLALKKAVTSANSGTTAATTATADLTQQLQPVNSALNDLVNKKNEAYAKLYEANKTETDQILSNTQSKQASIDNTPALKSEYVAATNKLAKSETLRQNAENAKDNTTKLNELQAATKLQVEALSQLNALDKKLSQPVAANTNTNTGTNTGNETPANNNETASNNGTNGNEGTNGTNSTNGTNGTNGTNANNETNSNTGANENAGTPATNNAGSAISTKTIGTEELNKSATTAGEVVTYFESSNITLKNPGANQLVKNTIADLKKTEEDKKVVDERLKNSGGSGENPVVLKSKAEALLVDAEDMSVKAFDTKTLANSKSGAEKDSLLNLAKSYEDRGLEKKMDAVKLNQQANATTYSYNTTAITELMDKLKKDNPDLAGQLEARNTEIGTLKSQADQIRNEANSLDNANAKIGSMMNAEEKEAELISKQNELIAELRKTYPDYAVKQPSESSGNTEEFVKKQKELTEQKFTGLTNLTNAFSLEYETSKNNTPANLSESQKTVKQNADELNAESKRLLIKATQISDEKEKEQVLTLAAKTAAAAVEQLNKVNGGAQPVAVNNTPRNNNNAGNTNTPRNNNAGNANTNTPRNNNAGNVAANTPRNNTPRNNTPRTNENVAANNTPRNNTPANTGRTPVKVEGLEVNAGNAYNNAKPIPVDAAVPDGLIFRVQIGAFKFPVPNNAFGGINPLNAERTPNGIIRYVAGNFNKYENAAGVKNDLQQLGYSDAFVVVYYNGKRIPLREAMDMLAKEGKTIDLNTNASAGLTANSNIPKAPNNPNNPNLNAIDAPPSTKNLEEINGLLFTVQIGVYGKQISQTQLFNLRPIYTERLPSGLYRYTAGVYSNTDKLVTDKNRVVALGVKDAFVSAYFNGKKIPFADGKTKQQDSATKMEPENPIIFPEPGTVFTPPVNNTPVNNAPANPPANAPNVQPFTNNVKNYPAATPENGIKATQDGVCFKVQIGAYSRQVPNDVASKFLAIKNWPVENKAVNGLYIYSVGNYAGAKFAKGLLQEVKNAGITDAFITVYRDGRKVTGAEATTLINQP